MPIDPVKLALRTEIIRAAMKRPGVRAKLSDAARHRDPATRNTTPLPPMSDEQRRTYKRLQPVVGREQALAALMDAPGAFAAKAVPKPCGSELPCRDRAIAACQPRDVVAAPFQKAAGDPDLAGNASGHPAEGLSDD